MSGARRSSNISTSASAATIPGLAAAVVTYRARSAMREIGKAFGLSNDFLARHSRMAGGGADREQRRADLARAGLRP